MLARAEEEKRDEEGSFEAAKFRAPGPEGRGEVAWMPEGEFEKSRRREEQGGRGGCFGVGDGEGGAVEGEEEMEARKKKVEEEYF